MIQKFKNLLISTGWSVKNVRFHFSKLISKKVVCKTPYFQRVPLIEKCTLLSLPLIPLLLANKGIRED